MSEAALFFSAFLSATLLPGSSEVVLGALVIQTPELTWRFIMIATLGNTLGAYLNFALGYLGRSVLKRGQMAEKAKKHLGRYGELILLLSWVPVIGDVYVLAAGYLKLNILRSAIFILIGKFLRYFALVALI